jgi:PAS domain S-box-containing protein
MKKNQRAVPVLSPPAEGSYEQLYHMLLESIPSSVLLVDRALRVVSANRNFLEKARRDKRATIGASIGTVFPATIMEFTRLEAKIRLVFDRGELLTGEQITYRAPGIPTRVYYYTVVPIKSERLVEHAMILMDDITEKVRLIEQTRRIERHLASVVESANDLVVSTDAEGRIISWNPAAERISGYPLEAVRGRLLAELCDPEQREEMTAIIRRLAQGGAVKSQELSLISRSGKPVPVAWSCSSMHNESGQVSGLVAVGRDLSERRAFEEQLSQSEKLAALGVMAGGIAHELRNPLSASFSAAQFLRDGVPDPEFRAECVQKILQGIERASTIIENLLRFARPSESDRMGAVDLVPVVRETVGLLAHQVGLRKIILTEDYPAAAVPVIGNTNLLQQVVMNLILNAYHAMPDGGELGIAVHQEAVEAVVRVRDTGSGIAPANLGKIFDPFFTTRAVGRGTGLGLSICYTIIKQHGGRIDVDSVEGRGSTFTVRLPRAQS